MIIYVRQSREYYQQKEVIQVVHTDFALFGVYSELKLKIEAIKEVRTKALYDAHMKQIRDRNARDDYVRMEGEDKMNRLVLSLIEAGRLDDIKRAAKDKEYRDRLYKEYGI